jgi:putative ABC transport system permease protein
MTPRPPFWARWLLSRLSLYEDKHSALGDFEETFHRIASQKGVKRARLWYSVQATRSFSCYLRLVFVSGLDLLANYIKVAIRSLRRHRVYSIINISGLAIGLAAVFLIVLYISHELSFDRHNRNANRIHRIVLEDFVGTPYILGDTLKEQVPGIEEIVRLKHLTDDGSILIQARDRSFMERALYMADASLFEVFTFKFLHGDPETALADPASIVLTETAARRYFGRDDALGEIIRKDDLSLQVSAVIADIPPTSHFHFNAVVPTTLYGRFGGGDDQTSWTSFNYLTYLLLYSQVSPDDILKEAVALVNSHQKRPRILHMQRLLDVHLHSRLRGELEENGNIGYLRIYTAVGFLILFLACINFMNLGSAHSINRSSEVGMRKVLGAQRTQIVRQFIGEAVLIAFLSSALAFILAQLGLPFFRQLSGRTLSWGSVPWGMLVPVLFLIILLTGVASGSYPAFVASSFQPVRILQGTLKVRSQRIPLRNLLVGFQFIISILFIGCTLFVLSQMHFLRTQKLGIDQERIISVRLPDEALGESEAIKAELLRHSAIFRATGSSFLPSVTQNRIGSTWEGRMAEEDINLWRITVDEDFIATFGIEVVEGEEFQAKHTPGSTYIVNQAAAKLIGQQAVGTTLSMSSGISRPGRIIGIVRDFNFRSLHHAIEPLVLFLDANRTVEFSGREYERTPFRYISVKAAGSDLKGAIQHVREVCRRFFPYAPDSWSFFDEEFGRMYRSEQKTAGLMLALSVIAVSLASMGLLGLSIYAAEKRRKEIGIRRVLGASVPSVLFLFFRDFILIHAAAVLVGFPIIYWAVNRWLAGFAYRAPIRPWIFVLTAVLTVVLFFMTGSSSVIKAVNADPVESLRYE